MEDDTSAIQVFLTQAQKKKFENHQTFQLSSTQLSASHGKHHIEIIMKKHHHRKLLNNVKNHRGFRFTKDNVVGGSFFSSFKPIAKNVLKNVAKSLAPSALDYIGEKSGHKNLTDALKPSINGVVDVIAGGKLVKGSAEMKAKMAHLRAMRKVKGGAIDGGNIFDDLRHKIKDG